MKQIGELQILTQAQYEREQQTMRALITQETLIRSELDRLSAQERAARETSAETEPMRSIGADVLWLGWVGRSKENLNMALAQILAQKEHHLARVRKAYGKVLVTQELAKADLHERRKASGAKQLKKAQEIALWKQLGM